MKIKTAGRLLDLVLGRAYRRSMHNNTGPNMEPETPETKHPDTEEPRPPEAGQEAEGGGGGTAEVPPSSTPKNSFEDLLRQMREMAGAVGGGTPVSDDERRSAMRAMRADLMSRVVGLLPHLIEYISIMNSGGSSEEDQPGAEEAEEPVAEYIPTGIPAGFGSRPFDVESALFGDQVKKQKRSARGHGFNLGLGLGSAIGAMGTAALVRELVWHMTNLSTDLGSVINAAFGKHRQAMPYIMRAAAPQVDPRDAYDIFSRSTGEYFPNPGPHAPRPARGLKYGASFPDETPGEYETGDPGESDDAPAVELPDFETFMGRVAEMKARVDAGEVEADPEIKAIFEQFGKLFGEFIPPVGRMER